MGMLELFNVRNRTFSLEKSVPEIIHFLNHIGAAGLISLTSLVDLVAQGESGTLVRIVRHKLDVDDGTGGNDGRRSDVTAVLSQQLRGLRISISDLNEVIPKSGKQCKFKNMYLKFSI